MERLFVTPTGGLDIAMRRGRLVTVCLETNEEREELLRCLGEWISGPEWTGDEEPWIGEPYEALGATGEPLAHRWRRVDEREAATLAAVQHAGHVERLLDSAPGSAEGETAPQQQHREAILHCKLNRNARGMHAEPRRVAR